MTPKKSHFSLDEKNIIEESLRQYYDVTAIENTKQTLLQIIISARKTIDLAQKQIEELNKQEDKK